MLKQALVAVLSVMLAVLLIPRDWSAPARLLSRQELSLYDGEGGSRGLYLAILGQVFDVSKGHQHYGPGRDASLAFITGHFTQDLTDDVSSLSPLQVVALFDWLSFYQRHYTPVGMLIGRFYHETGQPTDTLLNVEKMLAEGRHLKAQSDAERVRFPPCNSEWTGRGGRVWCSPKSGGVIREWTGVPRRLFSPASSVQCVCVKDAAEQDPSLQEYDGCPADADSCAVGEH
ncbi:neuferricin isoform X2 [Austrofundulus limnaeus]|uniref:Neuferricin n=1 Tax=Austrofundulus limnaeus TaxID=52670 RepID=A0A2I4DAA3_AUSLI|nr:PREDICTED: neuferricin isoform X2 [Austrofundulus limnaeus]